MKPLNQLLRANIAALKPYSSARDEFTGEASVFLDANENPFRKPYNRYPDPHQRVLKARIAELKLVKPENLFLGNGSDEPIDLLIRAFCAPDKDEILTIEPTYGMYQVAADIHQVQVRKVPLTENFELDADSLLAAVRPNTKLIFICSPNNPTGNSFAASDIEKVINRFEGIVVLDEAYIDYAGQPGFLSRLSEFPNLVILQTFSKAWGMAGIRLGMAFASPEIIRVLSHIKYPYNLNMLTQQKALELLEDRETVAQWIATTLAERNKMAEQLSKFPFIQKIFPSDANFILLRTLNADTLYQHLVAQQIIVRNRNSVALCQGCVRITIGTPEENQLLVKALYAYDAQ